MTRRSGVTLSKVRSAMYVGARLLGDVQAVRRGRVAERLWRRFWWRMLFVLLRGLGLR